MRNRIRLSVKRVILSAASLLFSMICFSQSCPLSAGDYKLNTQNASEANKIKRTQSGGVNYNQLWCPYIAAGQPNISVYVNWITSVPNNSYIFNWTCKPIISSKDIINLETKQAYATFGGYQINDDYRRGLLKPVAEKILQEVSPFAVPCPLTSINNSNNNNQDNTGICQKNFEKLRQLLEKKSGINHQLKILQDNTFNETASRDKLSMYNKFIVLLNDNSDRGNFLRNNLKGELYDLYNNPYERTRQAISYGLNPDASVLEVARTIRDVTAAQIDYFKDAPTFIQRYNNELIQIDTKMEILHREIKQKQCPGDYDINSCDLSGDWVFTRWDSDVDNGVFKETWAFTPISKGRYSAFNNTTGHSGIAEVYAHRIILKINLRPDYAITHAFLLNDACNSGGGQTELQVVNTRLTVQRKERTNTSFVQDKLYDISFNGKNYQGLYQRGSDNGVPLDVFFFSINHITGYQVEQDGQKLWGRFVRNPASDHPDQSTVEWWLADWVFETDKWVNKDQKIQAPKFR